MRQNVPLTISIAASGANNHDGGRPTMCPAPQAIEGLTGTWRGTLVLPGEGTAIPFSLQQGGSGGAGDSAGRLDFTGAGVAPAEVQLLEASATTYVALVGPYQDPATNAELVTVLEARRAGDRLYGTYRVRPVDGGRATEGRFEAVRSERAA